MTVAKQKTKPDLQIDVFEDLKAELELYNPMWVAAEAGVHFSTLYNWLSGTTKRPQLPTIVKVATALGFTLVLERDHTVKKARLRVIK